MIGRDRRRSSETDAAERRRRFRRMAGVAPDVHLILSIGAAMRTKGVDRTVRALAALPPELGARTQLVVLGAGDTGRIVGLARRLGLADRVRVLGPRDDVPDALLAADLLAHPARRENTGQAILEAMVAGLPVLTSSVCGYSGHVERAAAGRVLPEPFDQARYAAMLADMLSAPERSTWSRNGAAYGRAQDLYGGLDRAAELVEAVLNRRQGAKA